MDKLKNHLIGCDECGLITNVPLLSQAQTAQCPRCGHTLTQTPQKPYQTAVALTISCLILLVLSLTFPFMSFSVQGMTQEITLLNAAKMLGEFQNVLLAILLFTTVILFRRSTSPYFFLSLLKPRKAHNDNFLHPRSSARSYCAKHYSQFSRG